MSVYGPWSFVENSWQYTTVYDASGRAVCRLNLEDWGVDEDNQERLESEQRRIASLITQAPRLLQDLKAARNCLDMVVGATGLKASMDEAILMAEGEQAFQDPLDMNEILRLIQHHVTDDDDRSTLSSAVSALSSKALTPSLPK